MREGEIDRDLRLPTNGLARQHFLHHLIKFALNLFHAQKKKRHI